jgi:5-methylcytosine-specific restriction endonuclease McrA
MSSPRGRQGFIRQAAVDDAGSVSDPLFALAGLGGGGDPAELAAISGGAVAMGGVGGAGGLDCKVLVLNKAFVAVRVISARRAFSLLCRDIAEVIHVDDGRYVNYDFETWAELSQLRDSFPPASHDWVATVRFQLAVPKIIRLLGYDRLPAQIVKLNRRNLFARDRNQCQYCGKHFSTSELSIDHVVPRTQGGGDSWENLVCACIKCNARKGGRTPDEARMALIRKPVRPKRNPLISIRLGQDRYSSWKAFLDDAYWNVELK